MHKPLLHIAILLGIALPATAQEGDPLAAGKSVYMQVCFACHQPTGMGLPNVFPPIAKSEYVNGSAERLAAMILKGVMGPMTVEGKLYNSLMPAQEAVLSDAKIAAVLTYVRASFGNSAPAVTEEQVATTRKKFSDRKTSWTEAELKAWKEDGAAPAAAPASTSAPAAPETPTATTPK